MFSPHGMSHKDQEVLGCWGHRAASRGLYFFSVFSGLSGFFCKPGDILGRLQGMLLKALRGCRERCWLGRCFLEMLLGSAWSEHTPQLMSWNKGWKKSVIKKKCILRAFLQRGARRLGEAPFFLAWCYWRLRDFSWTCWANIWSISWRSAPPELGSRQGGCHSRRRLDASGG